MEYILFLFFKERDLQVIYVFLFIYLFFDPVMGIVIDETNIPHQNKIKCLSFFFCIQYFFVVVVVAGV